MTFLRRRGVTGDYRFSKNCIRMNYFMNNHQWYINFYFLYAHIRVKMKINRSMKILFHIYILRLSSKNTFCSIFDRSVGEQTKHLPLLESTYVTDRNFFWSAMYVIIIQDITNTENKTEKRLTEL